MTSVGQGALSSPAAGRIGDGALGDRLGFARAMLVHAGLPEIVAIVEGVGAVPFWRLYYHAVWATKNREPVIDDAMIAPIVQAIEQTVRDPGVTVFAVGVMPEHIHVFAQIPPSFAVASIIGRWKGASSHAANEFRPHTLAKLIWQSGYGVLSVSQSGFDPILAYVQNQRERHANRGLYGVLERTDDEAARRP